MPDTRTQDELLIEVEFRIRRIQSHASKEAFDPTMREIARLASEGQNLVERARKMGVVNA